MTLFTNQKIIKMILLKSKWFIHISLRSK